VASSSIRFPCPRCGGTMKSPAGQAGQTCHCPKCQALVVIPGAEGTGTGPVVSSDVPVVPPPISVVPVPDPSMAVTGTPVRPDAGVPVAESPPATPVQPAEETWYLRCPLCRSTVEVQASQQGTTVRCGDCHGPVLVKAPGGELRSSRKALGASRPADSGQPATDDVVTDFRLGEAVATPSYIPSPAQGIDTVELYGRVPVSRVLPARREEESTGGNAPSRPSWRFIVRCAIRGSMSPSGRSATRFVVPTAIPSSPRGLGRPESPARGSARRRLATTWNFV
jgi:ssDNA-binding Zn-finger/Zn-ribbon topoisomerase 1